MVFSFNTGMARKRQRSSSSAQPVRDDVEHADAPEETIQHGTLAYEIIVPEEEPQDRLRELVRFDFDMTQTFHRHTLEQLHIAKEINHLL